MKPFYEEKLYKDHYARVVYRVSPIIWLTEVEPSNRRKKFGSQILQKTLQKLKEEGNQFAYCFLEPDDSRAIKFYEHNGFKKKWGGKVLYEVELSDEWTHSKIKEGRWR